MKSSKLHQWYDCCYGTNYTLIQTYFFCDYRLHIPRKLSD